MSIEGNNFGISNQELNNNNLTPEIEKILEDSILTNEEKEFLYNQFQEKRKNIYDISEKKLNQLRDIIGSKSNRGWITDNDMEKLNSYSQTQEIKQEKTEGEQKTQEIKQEQTVTNENNLDEKIHIYEKEFPTINNVKELIDSIQNMQKYQIYIKKRLDRIKSRGLNDSTIITIKYNGKKDNVRISDLKGILKAVNFIIEADKEGVNNTNDEKIDTKAITNYARKHIEKNDIKGVERIVAEAISYLGKTEKNKQLKNEINESIKLLDKQGFNIKLEAWCAAFVRHVLVESGFKELAKNMDNTALSALGFPYETGGHIGIYVGSGRFIDGNSGRNTDRVTKDSIYRKYRKEGFIGRIKPEDIGNKSKVNFDLPPQIGSIMVFARGSDYKVKVRHYRNMIKKHS